MSGGGRGGARVSGASTVALTKQDASALEEPGRAPDVKTASPVVNPSRVKLVYKGTSYEPSSFVGTTPSYLTAHDYQVQEGTPFTPADVSKHKRVAVIGQTVVQELFAGRSAVGQSIKVNGSDYEVVGVLASKGSNGATNEDDVVMGPISTVEDSLTGYGTIDSITVQAKSQTPQKLRSRRSSMNVTRSPTSPNPASACSTRGRSCRPPAPRAACSRPCSARSLRSRCW
jgi:putative ABC transport system permease protein